jgi:hypothetical protein
MIYVFLLQNQWKEMFPCLISKAATVDVISDGEGPNRDGAVQLVSCVYIYIYIYIYILLLLLFYQFSLFLRRRENQTFLLLISLAKVSYGKFFCIIFCYSIILANVM